MCVLLGANGLHPIPGHALLSLHGRRGGLMPQKCDLPSGGAPPAWQRACLEPQPAVCQQVYGLAVLVVLGMVVLGVQGQAEPCGGGSSQQAQLRLLASRGHTAPAHLAGTSRGHTAPAHLAGTGGHHGSARAAACHAHCAAAHCSPAMADARHLVHLQSCRALGVASCGGVLLLQRPAPAAAGAASHWGSGHLS